VTQSVTIVDYGVGNLRSVRRAFEFCSADVRVSSDADEIANAERLVLPGVGAFGGCMNELHQRQLIEPVRRFVATGRPFLGICVGMQILLSVGEEFGEHQGLGFIPGRVQRIPDKGIDGKKHVLPFIGWAPLLRPVSYDSWDDTVLKHVPEGSSMYFVHSYVARPENKDVILAEYDYNGIRVTAAITKDNLTGVQFHPEKSGEAGLNLIRKFLGQ
jgi:glutamine amidotransferase